MSQQIKTACLIVSLACIVLCLPLAGFAQEAKIAVVNTQTLTFGSDEGKAINDKIDKRIQAISLEMEKLKTDIDAKEKRLRDQDRLMSATVKAQLQAEVKEDQIKFDRKNQDYQKEIEEMQNTLFGPITEKIQRALAMYVNEKGYHLLYDQSAENGNLVWSNPANNITNAIMAILNEDFKKAPAAPSAAAKPAAAPPAGQAPASAPTAPR